jgi:FG-GAP-like repeat
MTIERIAGSCRLHVFLLRLASLLVVFFPPQLVHAGCTTPSLARVTYPTDGGISVAVGDFNGDGKSDLVGTGAANEIEVYLGNGDGTFQPKLTVYASQADSVAVGDVNGDGKADIVAATSDLGAWVFLGNGDGTFQNPVSYDAGLDEDSVALADFNGDGKLDIVVANNRSSTANSYVSVLLGNGNGTFQAAVSYGVGVQPKTVAVGDFNGDGKPDLAVANYGAGGSNSTVSELLGNGDGTFQPVITIATGSGTRSLALADFNGDGKLDFVVANYGTGGGRVWLGNGDGTFRPPVDYSVTAPVSVAAGDFNGDGKMDLALATDQPTPRTSYSSLAVLLGNGDGTFQAPSKRFDLFDSQFLTVADFNGDGRLDTATPGTVNLNTCGGDSSDLNHDGQSDLILQRSDGAVQAWLMTPKSPTVMNQDYIWNGALSDWTVVGTGDFFEVGQADLVIQHQNGSVALWSMNGTTITSGQYIWPTAQPDWKVRGVADFNGDGWPDIVLQHTNGSVVLWLMVGPKVFQAGYLYSNALPDWTIRGTGDFNGDGQPEILLQHTNGSVALWTVDPGSFFPFLTNGQYVYGSALPGWTVRGTGDYDGDGMTDIVLQHQNGSIALWSMNGATIAHGQYLWPYALPGWTVRAAK